MPEIDILHQELLVEVLKYLSHEDRLNCATACKRFAEALAHPQLLKDIWFTVRRDEMRRATSVLMNSCRRYQNLRLIRFSLDEFDSEFWGKIGGTLRRLALDNCHWTREVLFEILRECSSLEYLSMPCYGAQDFRRQNRETCGASVKDVRTSLSNLKNLHFRTYSVDVLVLLLGLVPNVSSISLQVLGGKIPWNPYIHRTLAQRRIVTELDLTMIHLHDTELIPIMQAFSGTLRELRLDCFSLTNRAGAAIAECSRLRCLTLLGFYELETAQITKILRSNLGLEMLELKYCHSVTDDGLSPIHELRKLRRLHLEGSTDAITNEFLCRLGEILTLKYLGLEDTPLDLTTIRSITCLKNLEELHLGSYVQSPESLRIICMNLGKLQTLRLGSCENLSDADGLMLSRLKRLRTLSVRNASRFGDLTFDGVIWGSKMESLEVLYSSLTDLGLLSLVGQQGRLKDITLHGCRNITDRGLMTLLPRAPLLEELRLSFCRFIGSSFLVALEDCCPRLWYVKIERCATSCRAVKSFRERRPTVHVFFAPRREFD